MPLFNYPFSFMFLPTLHWARIIAQSIIHANTLVGNLQAETTDSREICELFMFYLLIIKYYCQIMINRGRCRSEPLLHDLFRNSNSLCDHLNINPCQPRLSFLPFPPRIIDSPAFIYFFWVSAPTICYFNRSSNVYSPFGIFAVLRYSLIALTNVSGLLK